ncbi:hypothetical protein [Idiomarina abyssalis]|uniref:hypothetical protein n=1 Tax=Idiomarina abyssalis TaxID=86102 RepID=UPI003A8CEA38
MSDDKNNKSTFEKIAVISTVAIAVFACIGVAYGVYRDALKDESRLTSIQATLADLEADIEGLEEDLKELQGQADETKDQATRNATGLEWLSKIASKSSESVQNKVTLMDESEKRELAFSISMAASQNNFSKGNQEPVTVGNTTFTSEEFIDLVEKAKDNDN